MDRSKVFTKVKTHLLAQSKQALDNDTCQYLTPNGLRCAIGCLIPDGHPSFSHGGAVGGLLAANPDLKKLWGVETVEDINFLRNLQFIHDEYEPEHWADKLETFRINNL